MLDNTSQRVMVPRPAFMGDKLDSLFQRQEELQQRVQPEVFQINRDFKTYTEEDLQRFDRLIESNAKALLMEATEIINNTRWKHWSQRTGDKKWGGDKPLYTPEHMLAIQDEIIDAQHFILNLAFVSGMDADLFYTRFCEKNDINNQRQDSGKY